MATGEAEHAVRASTNIKAFICNNGATFNIFRSHELTLLTLAISQAIVLHIRVISMMGVFILSNDMANLFILN